MNVNSIISMILRRFVSRGIRKAFDMAANPAQAPGPMSPQDRARAKSGKDTAKNASKMMRLGRRIGKF